jgi:hypothetical protein
VNGDGEDGGQERLPMRVFRAHLKGIRDSTHEQFSTENIPAIFYFSLFDERREASELGSFRNRIGRIGVHDHDDTSHQHHSRQAESE